MSQRHLSILLGLAASVLLVSAHADDLDAATRAAARKVAIGTCENCHGPEGHSILPKYPVLAGQHANYLAAQMHAFKAQTRGDPDALGYMWGMAATLDDDLITGLADYYSRQKPEAGKLVGGPALAHGKDLYLNGDPANGIPACATCHGPGAEGSDAFPRLAGQHSQYLIKQLKSFQSNLRNVAVMHGVAQGMKSEEMEAVALYLQSLGPKA